MKRRKLATTAAAAFGAAMTSMYAAPELNADIMDLTFSPSTNATGGLDGIFINEVGASFSQWNDSIGKTLNAGGLGGVAAGFDSSSTINASTFAGGSNILFGPSDSGTQFVGFSFNGNVGWFSLNLGGAGGTITYLDGEYGSAGESVHVGGTNVVPEPTTFAALSLLALGAVGIRRNRRI